MLDYKCQTNQDVYKDAFNRTTETRLYGFFNKRWFFHQVLNDFLKLCLDQFRINRYRSLNLGNPNYLHFKKGTKQITAHQKQRHTNGEHIKTGMIFYWNNFLDKWDDQPIDLEEHSACVFCMQQRVEHHYSTVKSSTMNPDKILLHGSKADVIVIRSPNRKNLLHLNQM